MDVRVAILRIEGTNCEDETERAVKMAGGSPEKVHLNQLLGKGPHRMRRSLDDYQMLIIPGGFSSGDYVRAGALFASRIKASLHGEMKKFVEEGRIVFGICNGFQVLVELGLLPGLDAPMDDLPSAVLAPNDSGHFECRHTFLRAETDIFSPHISKENVIYAPSAHAEGKFMASERTISRILEEGLVIFRYVKPDGKEAGYPWNPNGSPHNIAGITNPWRNVMGMMPHPERSVFTYQYPEGWRGSRLSSGSHHEGRGSSQPVHTIKEPSEEVGFGDGFLLFRALMEVAERL